VLAYLLQRQRVVSTASAPVPEPSVDLTPVRQWLDDHPERPWSLGRLADRAGYSPFHLLRAFRRSFHKTPYQYLVARRLDLARRLLADTARSVTQIAFAVGFDSVAAFSTRFRRDVGWPPSAYRARVLAQRARPLDFVPGCHVEVYGLRSPQFSKSLRARDPLPSS
jgi:AraC-like DNA-binding protein